ncbi:Helix-turn-helix domain-containing protein [Asanoa ishikariensis]|uniref:Helix-turn-helix domain-containing protein n=1 Tax=Asanoa ishikariensis TaxID=137265 RepID=A0A1H3RY90_9ACTN|nr:helix-turn-helix transcriptional regulator [Asanoa ishikariensis]SDZ29839.1 Helix-turn-helix domain-containing protein [Asanoa ishikariensis]
MTAPDAAVGPTARRIVVGAQLRRLREAAGVSREDAGYHVRGSASKISRMELGRVGFKERDIADLLTLYGVLDEAQREPLLALARDSRSDGWWHRYDDVLESWFGTYVGLEEAATTIRAYEVQFVPGLLQTAEYARGVVVSGLPETAPAEVDRRVKLRLERQRILDRVPPATYWVVMDEAALRRPVGGRAVMQGQLKHLLELSERPNITLQVMPLRRGTHTADGGSFSMLRFADPDIPDIVYVEQLVSALYMDKPEHVERYRQAMERLTVAALSPADTTDFLTKLRISG